MGYGMRGRRGAMSWADSEFQDASFGDDRLRQRAIRVCERLAEHPSASIPVACCGRAEVEAAYRFFSNDKVTAARVLGPIMTRAFDALPRIRWCCATRRSWITRANRPLELRRDLYLHVTTALTP